MAKRVLTCQMVSKERMTMNPEEFDKLEKKSRMLRTICGMLLRKTGVEMRCLVMKWSS